MANSVFETVRVPPSASPEKVPEIASAPSLLMMTKLSEPVPEKPGASVTVRDAVAPSVTLPVIVTWPCWVQAVVDSRVTLIEPLESSAPFTPKHPIPDAPGSTVPPANTSTVPLAVPTPFSVAPDLTVILPWAIAAGPNNSPTANTTNHRGTGSPPCRLVNWCAFNASPARLRGASDAHPARQAGPAAPRSLSLAPRPARSARPPRSRARAQAPRSSR